MNCRKVVLSADIQTLVYISSTVEFFITCLEYNLTGGKNMINARMLHVMEIMHFYRPDYKCIVERIILNKNNTL
jgi:hypothetical protein